ncbi:MFS transporter [Streptomyces sp. NPDC048603]|uniref:MFS transporter n=1 Tax=Streptomyces sp. NPDC048603 TaxID=3365577 RepID=UPI0037110B10
MTTSAPPTPTSPLRAWSAVFAASLSIFCAITSELMPVGLLRPMGADLEVSDGTAGLMMTVPGLVAAVSAPLVTVATGRVDRRLTLCLLIALMAVANLAVAVAPNFPVVLAARVLTGVSVGGFWAIVGGLAMRLVPEHQVGRAMAVIFGGTSAASVLGVPAGTLIGEVSGWRAAFAAVGGLALLTLLALSLLLPPLPPRRAVTFAELPSLLRRHAGVRAGVIVTFLLVTGQFTAYTFVRPVLQDVSGVAAGLISPLLLGYGLAGLAGNFLSGTREARRTLLVISLALTAVLPLLALLAHPVAGGVLVVLWGLAFGGVSVSVQNWMNQTAPESVEAASSLMVSMFCLAIAAGAVIGGFAVDGIAVGAAPAAGAVLTLLAAVTILVTRRARSGRAESAQVGRNRDTLQGEDPARV